MTGGEKITWLVILLWIWGLLLFMFVLVSVNPGENAHDAYQTLPWATGGFTLAYLLILSWRAAYLIGRRQS